MKKAKMITTREYMMKFIYQIDINKEATEFYKLFLGIDLNDKQLDEIMGKDFE